MVWYIMLIHFEHLVFHVQENRIDTYWFAKLIFNFCFAFPICFVTLLSTLWQVGWRSELLEVVKQVDRQHLYGSLCISLLCTRNSVMVRHTLTCTILQTVWFTCSFELTNMDGCYFLIINRTDLHTHSINFILYNDSCFACTLTRPS